MAASNLPVADSFAQFNESRTTLAQQFQELIGIVGNHVFHGEIDLKAPNMLEEINRQSQLSAPEKNVLKHIHYYASNLMNSRFLLGVFGRFKAGKSTILNALAGRDISPMDTRISTGVLNFTYWNKQVECVVVYDSGQEMNIDPAEKIYYVDFKHNPDNEKGIHSVRHGSPHLDLQEEIVFVDTPGLEAVNRVHEQITLDFVTQCHAAIVVSTYPPFGETEINFYQRIKEVIPNVFLVQNLPADKLEAWVELETQTLINLYKLGFYTLDRQHYPDIELRSLLTKIGDKRDEQALRKFKEIHHLNVYSINARDAYHAGQQDESTPDTRRELENSRFIAFKQDLYNFLAGQKGSNLIKDYLQKGRLVLRELISMVNARNDLLQKSLDEIEEQIKEQEYTRQKIHSMVEMQLDRATLKMMESHKKMKAHIMDRELTDLLTELDKIYGEMNIFRLRKPQVKQIKGKIIDFNRLFGQRFQDCLKELHATVVESQEKIANEIDNHGIFSKLEMKVGFSSVSMGEISGAGYIDYGFEIAFRGSIAYIIGSIAGGTGLALLGAGPWTALIGGAIGLGLSVPLTKYCAPLLEFGKDLVSKIAKKPAHKIFEDFRSQVRARLDEIESLVLDPLVQKFKQEVLENTEEYLDLFSKRLLELKEQKAHGMTQQECEQECGKLQSIIEQLQNIDGQFQQIESKDDLGSGTVQGLLKGIKGYFNKFRS